MAPNEFSLKVTTERPDENARKKRGQQAFRGKKHLLENDRSEETKWHAQRASLIGRARENEVGFLERDVTKTKPRRGALRKKINK